MFSYCKSRGGGRECYLMAFEYLKLQMIVSSGNSLVNIGIRMELSSKVGFEFCDACV